MQPVSSLSTTLKEQLFLPLGHQGYLDASLLFGQATAQNLACSDFHAELFSTNRGYLVPFVVSAVTSVNTETTAQLSLFTRLRLLNNAGFYLFLLLSLKQKFVLCFYVQPLRHVALYAGFPFHTLGVNCPCLRWPCITKAAATTQVGLWFATKVAATVDRCCA